MLQATFDVSIGASATDQNVLQTEGLRIRTIPQEFGVVKIALFETGSAAGLESSFFIGNNNPVENSVVNAQNRVPVVPDDLVAADMLARGGEQLQLTVVNTTAGALTYNGRIIIEELSVAELAELGV